MLKRREFLNTLGVSSVVGVMAGAPVHHGQEPIETKIVIGSESWQPTTEEIDNFVAVFIAAESDKSCIILKERN